MEGEKTRFQQVIDKEVEPVGKEKGYANLSLYQNKTLEERKNFHQLGQKAQAEKKRQRKTLKDDLLNVLQSTELTKVLAKESNNSVIEELAQQNGITVQDLITASTVIQCLQGNTRTIEYLRDTIGEKPKDDIQINADIVTSADRKLIENLRKRLSIVQSDEDLTEEEKQ